MYFVQTAFVTAWTLHSSGVGALYRYGTYTTLPTERSIDHLRWSGLEDAHDPLPVVRMDGDQIEAYVIPRRATGRQRLHPRDLCFARNARPIGKEHFEIDRRTLRRRVVAVDPEHAELCCGLASLPPERAARSAEINGRAQTGIGLPLGTPIVERHGVRPTPRTSNVYTIWTGRQWAESRTCVPQSKRLARRRPPRPL